MDTNGAKLPTCLCLRHLLDYCIVREVGLIPQGRFCVSKEYCLWCINHIELEEDIELKIPQYLYGLCEKHIPMYLEETNISCSASESADTNFCVFCEIK